MNSSPGKRVAFIGMMAALIFSLLAFETYIMKLIPFLNPPPAILTIPCALALSMYSDWKKMFLGGVLLGVSSFILSFMIGFVEFSNPLISIFPRILMGMAAFGTAKGISYLLRNNQNRFVKAILPYSIGAAAGVIVNTVLVLGMIAVFFDLDYLGAVLTTVISVNFVLELSVSVVAAPFLVKNLKSIDKSFVGENTNNQVK